MPTQIVLFYSGGAADGNWLCYEAAQTNRRNREGWVYNFCMDNFCIDKNCTINQLVIVYNYELRHNRWRFSSNRAFLAAKTNSLLDERSGVLE